MWNRILYNIRDGLVDSARFLGWVDDWVYEAILAFHANHPFEGYRRLTFMLLDADVDAMSPSSVYRVFHKGDRSRRWNGKSSKTRNRISFVTHVRTSPYYPQCNGKIEQWHLSVKSEYIRSQTPLSMEDARSVVERRIRRQNARKLDGVNSVSHYNC